MGDAIDALERIAYLLERGRAETYKVRAFRRAARSLKDLDPEAVRTLAAAPGQAVPLVAKVGELRFFRRFLDEVASAEDEALDTLHQGSTT